MTSKDDTAFTDALEGYLHWKWVLMTYVNLDDEEHWADVYSKMQECKKIMNDLVNQTEKK